MRLVGYLPFDIQCALVTLVVNIDSRPGVERS